VKSAPLEVRGWIEHEIATTLAAFRPSPAQTFVKSVDTASVSGIRWLGVRYASYAATKAAVTQFTRVIALQYARSGIRAN
jgi:NAD(P)-dependent dehydrogenase (short-subunit alcohol dehydrogenase family)